MTPRILYLACFFVAAAAQAQPWSVRMADAVMERRPILRERWDYETGTVLRGFEELYELTGDERYLAYIRRNVDAYLGPDGVIQGYREEDYNLDNINTGKLLFLLYEKTRDERYRKGIEALHGQLLRQPTTTEGGYWHKQRYPYQIWLDGLYMAEPFAARYALAFVPPERQAEAFRHIALQFQLAARYLRDPATGLFYHGWDERRAQIWADSLTGRSPHFWGRAVGWYAMALVDVLDLFPADHPERSSLVGILQNLAEALRQVQDPVTGVWYQILDLPNREGNYLEASASSMFVYALARGARRGYLDPSYREAARRGFRGLLDTFITEEGGLPSLTRVVSVGGLGGDNNRDGSFAYYLSEPVVSDDPKGVGPFIMAALELETAP